MKLETLIGKTIVKAERMRNPKYDDEGWLRLTFTDGTSCVIEAGYGSYTGRSEDEYPTYIDVIGEWKNLVPVEAPAKTEDDELAALGL